MLSARQPATAMLGDHLGGGEDREVTIANCLADRENPDRDIRLRAVMILGKYPGEPRVVNALTTSLTDPEPAVRRAAVVSLAEIGSFPPKTAEALLTVLADPDVQVRRLASAMLANIIIPLRLQELRERPAETGRQGFTLSPVANRMVVRAFADDDHLVRKNMLAGEGLLRGAIPAGAITPLLADPVAETRALAIAAVRSRLPAETFVETVAPLVADPDVHVRRGLARTVARERTAAAGDLLLKLSEDADPTVAATAAEGLFRQQKTIPKQRFLDLLEAREVAGTFAARLIALSANLGPEAVDALLQLTTHERSAYRAAALNALAQTPTAIGRQRAMDFFADPSLEVRRATQRLLHGDRELPRKSLERLLRSPYEDVRQFVLLHSRHLPIAESEELLGELLLDESLALRRQTLAEYARRRPPGALQMLSLSLADDTREIKEAALVGLYRLGGDDAHRRLQEFAEQTGDEELKAMVAMLLANRRPQPPPRPRPPPPTPTP